MVNITYENTFNGFDIFGCQSGMYVEILSHQGELMSICLQGHSKVMQVRFDLHYPADNSIVPCFEHISVFSYNFSRRLSRMCISSHRLDPHYLWVREIAHAGCPHYHFLVWINANAIQHEYTIFNIAEEVWGNTLNTNGKHLVHYCLNKAREPKYDNGIIMNRSSDDYKYAIQEAFRAGSYLAKVDSKDDLNKFEHKFGCSRV